MQSASRGIQSVGREWDHVHVHEFKSVQLFVFHISSTKDEDDFFCSSSSRSSIFGGLKLKIIKNFGRLSVSALCDNV